MKYITTIFFFILSLKGYSQSIDKMVYDISNSVSTHKTDSLSNSLDSSVTYTVFTKDATPINVATLFVPNNSVYQYKVTLLTMNTANGDAGNTEYNIIIKNISNRIVIFRNAAVMTPSFQSTISSARYSLGATGTIIIVGVKNLIMKWTVKIEETSHVTVP